MLDNIYTLVSFELIPEEISGRLRDFIINLPSENSFAPTFLMMDISIYIVANIFLPLFCIFIYLLLLIFHYLNYWLIKSYAHKFKILNRMRKYSKEVIDGKYNFMIRTFIELSLDISVCALIEIIMRQNLYFGDRVSFFISFCLLLTLIMLTVYFYLLITYNTIKINYPEVYEKFHEKYNVLWDGLRSHIDSPPMFFIVFIVRRFTLAVMLVWILTIDNLPRYF